MSDFNTRACFKTSKPQDSRRSETPFSFTNGLESSLPILPPDQRASLARMSPPESVSGEFVHVADAPVSGSFPPGQEKLWEGGIRESNFA